jgi:hypothetical protein
MEKSEARKGRNGSQVVWERVERVIRPMEGVEDCIDRNWKLIPFWLNNSDGLQTFHDSTTVKRYSGYWGRSICYCLRTLEEEEAL